MILLVIPVELYESLAYISKDCRNTISGGTKSVTKQKSHPILRGGFYAFRSEE